MARLWFRAKRYGWGWTPATIEGWIVMAAFFAATALGVLAYVSAVRSAVDRGLALMLFVLWMALLSGVLIVVCYAKGERPGWRWGK